MRRLPSVDQHVRASAVGCAWEVLPCEAGPPLPQEPRHLQLLGGLEESSVFSLIAGRKQYGAPTDYGFCIKVPHPRPVWGLPLPMASRWGFRMKPQTAFLVQGLFGLFSNISSGSRWMDSFLCAHDVSIPE